MLKRGFVLFVFVFLIVNSSHIVLAENPPGFDELPIINETQNLHQTFDEQKWDYLSKEWKGIFLNQTSHPNIYRLNVALNATSPAFFVVTGSSYDFSWNFFVALFLWLLFFLLFADAIILFSTFSDWVSVSLAFIFSSIAGHIGIYRILTPLLFKFFFFKEGIWKWLGPVTFIISCFIFLVLLDRFFKFGWRLRQTGKKNAAARTQKQNQEILQDTVDTIGDSS